MRSRQLSVLLVVMACLAGLVSHLGWWSRSALLSEEGFAELLVEGLDDADTRSALSTLIVEEVVEDAQPRLVAARPVVEVAVNTVLSSDAFGAVLRAAALDVHRSVFDQSAPTVTVQITRLVDQARDLVRSVDPELADAPGWDEAAQLPLATEEFVELARNAESTNRWVTYMSTVLMVVFAGASVWVSDARRRTLADLGAGMLAISGLSIVGSVVLANEAERLAQGQLAEVAAQFGAVFAADLRGISIWVGAAGLVVVAAAAARNPDHPPPSLKTPIELVRSGLQAHHVKSRPALRSIGLVILGLVMIYLRDEVIPILVLLTGAWLAFVGVYGLLDVVGRQEARRGSLLVSPRALWIATVTVLAAAVAVAILQSRGALDNLSGDNSACNGSVELCDRPLNEVAFAATHNSMAAARESRWFSPYHLGGIRTQLDDGVRALLIDTHYGKPGPGGSVFSANPPSGDQEGITEQERQRAASLREQFPDQSQTASEIYLCHAFCELGATSLADALGDVAAFMESNPREVVILFVEDLVAPEDFAEEMSEAGLDELAHEQTVGMPWPTLGQMIDSDKRLVVLSENEGPPPSWYLPGFDLVQDTPFDSATIAELSCAPSRGPQDAELLLLNHWVQQTPPDRDLARRANSYDVLMDQVRQCEATRGQTPNIIAVDFYADGDLFRVIDELNGL